MPAEKFTELLTAALDGELSSAEEARLHTLLRENQAARSLFEKMKRDAVQLKNLRRITAPAGLKRTVLRRIRVATPATPAATIKTRSPLRMALTIATAAVVLIAITLGSFSYFSNSHNPAKGRPELAVATPPKANPRESSEIVRGPEPRELPENPINPPPAPNEFVKVAPESGPSPRLVEDALFSPSVEMPEIEAFQLDKIRVSKLFSMRELADENSLRQKLRTELAQDELIRLDLFCASTPKGLDAVQARLKAKGINATIDAHVAERIRKKLPTEIVIFTELLSPSEVAELMIALGADDRKTSGSSGAGEFDTLVVAPFLPTDLDRLGRLLGATNVMPKLTKSKSGVDIQKPLPDGTAQAVANSLTKMGGGALPSKTIERSAVVVAYSPMNPMPGNSKEIRHFLEHRGERKADTKPLMLVLRTIVK